MAHIFPVQTSHSAEDAHVDVRFLADFPSRFFSVIKVSILSYPWHVKLMLNQDKEKHPIIFLKDMKYKELQAILEYMYRGEVVIPHDQLTSLLQVAESLQIKGLGCGEKSQTPTGNRGLIQTHPQQLPQPQPQLQPQPLQPPPQQQQAALLQQVVVKPVQARPPAPARGVEAAPQVVDLTDEPRIGAPVRPAPAEAAKRPLPQAASRAKRVAYPAAVLDRFNQSTLASASPIAVHSVHQQQNVIVTNASPVPVASVQTPPKANPVGSRQTNEPGGQGVVQVLMPPTQRPETHDIRDAGNQPEPHKSKPRTVPRILQRKSSVLQPSPRQSSSPVAMPSQNALVSAPRPQQLQIASKTEAAPATETNSAGQAITSETAADKVGKTATATPPPAVEQANGAAKQVRDSEPQDSLDSAEPAEDVGGEDPGPESQKETAAKKNTALDKPGPSGVGKAKAGRRGRLPASERRFQCTECDKRFTQKNYLENHLRIHDGECYECDNCTKTFLTRAALVKHLRAHAARATAAPPHKCQLCGAVFPSSGDLEKHLTDHTMAGADDP
ncbi:Longitudinals lacking protein, isoforms A/B/D/L [Gryllus bimaculatus]|nr:Longitudinals lacking protein, isoforms A/B/D/L [Gryllus bimaculatus]